MQRISLVVPGLRVVAPTLFGCASAPWGSGWVAMIEGDKGLENWNRIGGANWRPESGAIVNVAAVPVPIRCKAGGA